LGEKAETQTRTWVGKVAVKGYEFIEPLSEGGIGNTSIETRLVKARQVSLDRVVALRVLDPGLATRSPNHVKDFLEQGSSALNLNDHS